MFSHPYKYEWLNPLVWCKPGLHGYCDEKMRGTVDTTPFSTKKKKYICVFAVHLHDNGVLVAWKHILLKNGFQSASFWKWCCCHAKTRICENGHHAHYMFNLSTLFFNVKVRCFLWMCETSDLL